MAALIDPDAIDLDFCPRRREDLTGVEVDGEAVLYEPINGGVHRLDRLATALWNCFDGSASIRELGDDLVAIYHESTERLRQDVLGYVRTLGCQGLLTGVRPTEAAKDDGGP